MDEIVDARGVVAARDVVDENALLTTGGGDDFRGRRGDGVEREAEGVGHRGLRGNAVAAQGGEHFAQGEAGIGVLGGERRTGGVDGGGGHALDRAEGGPAEIFLGEFFRGAGELRVLKFQGADDGEDGATWTAPLIFHAELEFEKFGPQIDARLEDGGFAELAKQ